MANESDEEQLLRENFDPDVLLGRRPFGKRVWLVASKTVVGKPQPPRPTPALVLLKGGKQD
jgi:hypothetical protein